MPTKTKAKPPNTIPALDKAIEAEVEKLGKIFDGSCYPLLLDHTSIDHELVDDVYNDLRTRFGAGGKRLAVVIHSGGGDIDAAYNLALLLRRYATDDLVFFIPRWAKSAATLLVCAGDSVKMTPVAELGPLDPQITWTNPLEKRRERFSPLDINSTLTLIRDEYRDGNEKLAAALTQRLQFPLTLGSFQKSLEHGEQYLRQLLSTRMFRGDSTKPESIAKKLTHEYTSHGACIGLEEAQAMSLKVEELTNSTLDSVWDIYCMVEKKRKLELERQRQRALEDLKNLPRELLDRIPQELLQDHDHTR